jgi:hypothetical protein
MTALRARATADLEAAQRVSGVAFGAERFVALTPVAGVLACNGADSRVTFRVSAVDRRAGSSLTTELQVGTDATDRTARVRLGHELARHFGASATRSAML